MLSREENSSFKIKNAFNQIRWKKIIERSIDHSKKVSNFDSACRNVFNYLKDVNYTIPPVLDFSREIFWESLSVHEYLVKGDRQSLSQRLSGIFRNLGSRDGSLLTFTHLSRALAQTYEHENNSYVGTPYKDYLMNYLLDSENDFSKKSMTHAFSQMGQSTIDNYSKMLFDFNLLLNTNAQEFLEEHYDFLIDVRDSTMSQKISPHLFSTSVHIPDISNFQPSKKRKQNSDNAKENKISFKNQILELTDWNLLPRLVADFNKETHLFTGDIRFSLAMTPGGKIVMVPTEPNVTRSLEGIMGYDAQKSQILNNTENLINGKPSNNLFISGPPGTGKSSIINGLLSKYSSEGLRVLDVSTEVAPYIREVFQDIENNEGYKFILFVDEFKVGDNEHLYDELKKTMEGSFNTIPQNANLYVVSNEEKAVQLGFGKSKDRTVTALEDRFGLIVRFDNPDEETQRKIMDHYLSENNIGLNIDDAFEIFKEYCSGRGVRNPSPRSIENFVKTLQLNN